MDQRGRSRRDGKPDLPSIFWNFLNTPQDFSMGAMLQGPRGPLVDAVRSMPVLDQAALATAPLPIAGDLVGLAADARRYAQEPESRTLPNFGLSALGMLPFIPGMTAFHGTPHRFAPEPDAPYGKFRLDKIGTGEGAQAYGHGIYVAESPDVAGSYRRMGGGDTLVVRRGGEIIAAGDEINDDLLDAYKFLEMGRRDAGQFPHNAAYYAKRRADEAAKGLPGAAERNSRVKALIDEYKDAQFGYEDISSLYKVDLPDEQIEKMLDWDAPLSEQPESVRKALSEAGLYDEGAYEKAMAIDAEMARLAQDRLMPSNRMREERRWMELAKQRDELLEKSGNIKGQGLYEVLAQKHMRGTQIGPGREAASRLLNEMGIPGIKYWDGNSRTAGKGTSNFVLFDPDIAKIIGRE